MKLNIDKKYLVAALVIITVVALVCTVSCVIKGQEKFTDIKGTKKNILISDENGDISLYPVDKLEGLRNNQFADFETKFNTNFEEVFKRLKAVEDRTTETRAILIKYFPSWTNYEKGVLQLSGRRIEAKHLDVLLGNRDILIYNPMFGDKKAYLQAVSNRDDARFYGNSEPVGTLNPRLRLLT